MFAVKEGNASSGFKLEVRLLPLSKAKIYVEHISRTSKLYKNTIKTYLFDNGAAIVRTISSM